MFVLRFILCRPLLDHLHRMFLMLPRCLSFSMEFMWEYWQAAFPSMSVLDMFDFVEFDIDDERSEFVRSLAHRGSWPPP